MKLSLKFSTLTLLSAVIMVTAGCSKDESGSSVREGSPTVKGSTIATITSHSARYGGEVTDEGKSAVQYRGVVWSTQENPTVELATRTANGTGTGPFSSIIIGLEPGTIYYVRAYATNNHGTGYGEQVTFVTEQSGGSLAHYIDENGVDRGEGIEIKGIIWAPVNCGYDSTYLFGKLYQWGRKYGCGYSDSTYNEPLIQTPQLGRIREESEDSLKFYMVLLSPWDWLSPSDDNRWNAGTDNMPEKTKNDPCPTGWRIPTLTEMHTLIGNNIYESLDEKGWDDMKHGYWYNGTASPKVGDGLFLPAAGMRFYDDAASLTRGESGFYWASTADGSLGSGLLFYEDGSGMGSGYRAYGVSVRCVLE